MKLVRDLFLAALFTALMMAYESPKATVPCGTDQECAELNPGIEGSYAFPWKAKP